MTLKKKKILVTILLISIGMLAGLTYWRFVGCSSGGCAITSRWFNMMLFGGVIGYLIGDSFKWKTQENNGQDEQNISAEK